MRSVALALTALVVGVFLPTAGASTAPATAQSWSDGVCTDADGITVVIDFQELGGGVNIRCAPGPVDSGLDALTRAGISWEGTRRFPGFVCRIAGRPGPDTEPCGNTPPASAYWSYWLAPRGGAWCYSDLGAANRIPPPGTVEGWSFALNRATTEIPPPRFDPPPPLPGVSPTPLDPGDCTTPSSSATTTSPPTNPPPTVRPEPTTAPTPATTARPGTTERPTSPETSTPPTQSTSPAGSAPPRTSSPGGGSDGGPGAGSGGDGTPGAGGVDGGTDGDGSATTEQAGGATTTVDRTTSTTRPDSTGDAGASSDDVGDQGAIAADDIGGTGPSGALTDDESAGARGEAGVPPIGAVDLSDDGRGDGGSAAATLLGVLAIAAVAGAGFWAARRRQGVA